MNMDMPTTNTINSSNSPTGTPIPWPEHHHGVPILNSTLTPEQRLYWESYNTTTYFTLQTPHKSALHVHLFTIVLSGIFLYPILLVLNNVKSKKYIPVLYVQAIITFISCISYSIFINNVPELYPNMVYTKLITGLAVFTALQVTFSTLDFLKNYYNYYNTSSSSSPSWIPLSKSEELQNHIPLDDITPSSPTTLFDHDSVSDFNLNEEDPQFKHNPFFTSSVYSIVISIFHNLSTWGLFFYFMILYPTLIADLSLFGMKQRVFNLLAHFIKGGIFFLLGVLSLARYCGCFSHIGGAWNQSAVSFNDPQNGIFIKIHKLLPTNGLILSFEFMESLLIFTYGSTNIFLEHLSNSGGEWSAKDLQHASIAFLYLGAGICGLLTEFKLNSWKKSLFNKTTTSNKSLDLVTPGFSPNPFPIFTIFWTGLLMSKHSQASSLSTEIHVQWGSLLTYGTFFRLLTFLLMSYPPFQSNLPTKPLTELITSFCLLSGGLIFMESTDQVIEALAYRGLTPMFTMNVSVGVIALVMAWIMTLVAFKDKLKSN